MSTATVQRSSDVECFEQMGRQAVGKDWDAKPGERPFTRALERLGDGLEALEEILADHGGRCSCKLCNHAQGACYVLKFMVEDLEAIGHSVAALRDCLAWAQSLCGCYGDLRLEEQPGYRFVHCSRCQAPFTDPDEESVLCPVCMKKKLTISTDSAFAHWGPADPNTIDDDIDD